LLKVGAGAGAGLLLPLHLPTAANALTAAGITPFTEQLPTLAEIGVIDGTTGVPVTIDMINAEHKFHTNLTATKTFTYRSTVPNTVQNQDYLGPVILAKRGTPLTVNVTNSLGAHPLANAMDYAIPGNDRADATHPRAAIHLHGGNTSPEDDGDPTQSFGFGVTQTYHYPNNQEAAGLWYHDHAMGITRLNVLAGLASGYVLRDVNDDGSGDRLPAYLPGKNYEVPLILQDRSFNKDGSFAYPWNTDLDRAWVPEFFGDVPTVNGKALPNLKVDKGKYRFRVYNGSQARFYNLRFMYGGRARPFFQIGTDGGLLDNPVSLTSLLLATGERADLVVDFADLPTGAKIILTNDAVTPYPSGPSARADGGNPLPQIMRFTVNSAQGWVKPLTTSTDLRLKIPHITRLADYTPDKTRDVALVEVHNADGAPTMVTMNNRTFANDSGAPQVASNSLEEWTLINTTVDAHPMHVHYAQFQVINREAFTGTGVASYVGAAGYLIDPVTGEGKVDIGTTPPVDPTWLSGYKRPPAANELGWKDTIMCLPGEVTRIRIAFGPDAVPNKPMAIGTVFKGDYVSHCHILEHEENDMMMRFKIV